MHQGGMADLSRSSRDREYVQLCDFPRPTDESGIVAPGGPGERDPKALAIIVLSERLRRLACVHEGLRLGYSGRSGAMLIGATDGVEKKLMNAPDAAERLRSASQECGIPIVEGHLQLGEPVMLPQIVLGVGEAVALIAAVRPPVLYLSEVRLRIDEIVDEARSDLSLPDDATLPQMILEPLHRLETHAGEICQVLAHFTVGGVLHSTFASASWFDAFEDALEAEVERASDASAETDERERSARAAQVDFLARKLVAEPAFTYGRTSAAKRLLLAERMFPDEDRYLLTEAVDRAEQLDWLAQSGFTSRES